MSKELVLSCMKADPITGAHIASLTGLEADVIAKTCYALHKEGAIKRVKVPNTGAKKQGSSPTVYAYYVDDGAETVDKPVDEPEMPAVDPAWLASANRMLGERLDAIAKAIGHDGGNDGGLVDAVSALAKKAQAKAKHETHLAELIEKAARLQADNAQLRTDYHADVKALQARIDGLLLANHELQDRIADLEANEPLPYSPLPIPSGKPVYAGYTTVAISCTDLHATEEDARESALYTLRNEPEAAFQVAVCGILAVAENKMTQSWIADPKVIQFEQ